MRTLLPLPLLVLAMLHSFWVVAKTADASKPPRLLVAADEQGRFRVSILAEGKPLLVSPPDGLWSVATGWDRGWPSDWRHAHATHVERLADWTVLRGEMELEGGKLLLSDSYRPHGRVLQCIRRFFWTGRVPLSPATLSIRFVAPGKGRGVLLPGILYHGNPSGARSGRTPVYSARRGEEAVFEEHRFPAPFVSFEWPQDEVFVGVAMHSVPSPVPFANLPDQWWSLGVCALQEGTELVLLSGPCASNGRRGQVKAIQSGFLPYDGAWLELTEGAIVEKSFFLEAYPLAREGSGFQRAVHTSLHLFKPFFCEDLPSLAEILDAKYRFSETRYLEREGIAGFRKYPDRNLLVLGWCGQAAAPGYAFSRLNDRLGGERAREMAQRSLDFLSGAKFYEDGFHTWYDADRNLWYQPDGRTEWLSQGQAMLNFARAIRAGKENGFDTSSWEKFLWDAADFHSNRILDDGWEPTSTNEAFFVAPLCLAYQLSGTEVYRRAAEKAGEFYARRHLSMREPYWGGTLDATCEDKEGAFAAFQGFLALYELTGQTRYLEWARHACDVILTYLVVWNIDLPPGRLRDHGFKTQGWTAVSVQNHHIDVYGVLIAPEIYRLGQILGDRELMRLALVMYRSCGQLIDPYGSQGEQPQQTNYAQRGEVREAKGLRGGYVEDWTVFWITAHFLQAAARFDELGVDPWSVAESGERKLALVD